jgi:hypothetical protein
MKSLLYPLLLITFLSACSSKPLTDDDKFKVNYIDCPVNGAIQDIYVYNNLIIGKLYDSSIKFFVLDSSYNHVLDVESKLNAFPNVWNVQFFKSDILLLNGSKVVIFDSAFNRKMDIEAKFNQLKPQALFSHRDSLYLFNSKDYFLVNSNYTFTLIDTSTFFKDNNVLELSFGAPKYTDSTYNVYACGAGEFGGNVFFQNKSSLQTYSYPTYFADLFYYRSAYHLIHSYDGWSKYTRIPDPTKLYRLDITGQRSFCCNCDSGYKEYFYDMSWDEQKQWRDKRGMTTYFDTVGIQTLTTFSNDGNFYSLCMNDSSFLVLKHTDTISFIQSFPKMDKRVRGYMFIRKAIDKDKIIIASGSSGMYSTGGDFDSKTTETGLIVIKGKQIDIYESYNEKKVKVRR